MAIQKSKAKGRLDKWYKRKFRGERERESRLFFGIVAADLIFLSQSPRRRDTVRELRLS